MEFPTMAIHPRQIFSLLTLGICIAINPVSANTGETLKSLHKMQTTSLAILADYYMFSGLDGDSRYSRAMDTGIKQFDASLKGLTLENQPTDTAELANIASGWQNYKELIITNRTDIITQGYANAHLVGKLEGRAIELSTKLGQSYEELQTSHPTSVSKWTQYSRKMAVVIQKITAEYTARSANGSGLVVASKVHVINDGGMGKQVKVFNNLLSRLKKAPKTTRAINKNIDQLSVKWAFIEKSVTNYNENTVPFIVNSYAERITKSLTAIGDHYN